MCIYLDSAGKGGINIGMAKAVPKPIFCVVLSEGTQWSLEAEWPDGTIEQVNTFKAHAEAVDWLTTRSAAWLECRNVSGSEI
jgi:hypothetical protein